MFLLFFGVLGVILYFLCKVFHVETKYELSILSLVVKVFDVSLVSTAPSGFVGSYL